MIFYRTWFILAVSVVLHLSLVWFGLNAIATPMGDITFAYQPWFEQFAANNKLLGVTEPWVYPVLALPAILMPGLLGNLLKLDYQTIWLAMSIALDLLATLALLTWGAKSTKAKNQGVTPRVLATYCFIGMQFMLGPVAISRLDNLSVALAVIALVALHTQREKFSTVLLTIAVWIKVWPVALLLAASARAKKLIEVPLAAVVTSLAILAAAFLAGANSNLFSFFTAQSDRGIQVEAPVALVWLWQHALGNEQAGAYFSNQYLTFQVVGDGTQLVASLMGIAMLIALAITATLAWFARKNLAMSGNSQTAKQQLFGWVSLTAILDLLVFNKVGSPQYQAWLIVPIIWAVLNSLQGWRTVGFLIAGLMPITWLIYPVFYDNMLQSGQPGLLLLTLRNIGLVVLLVLANTQLTKLAISKRALLKRAV